VRIGYFGFWRFKGIKIERIDKKKKKNN